MKVLIFGSRSLTWRHLPVFRALALHTLINDIEEAQLSSGLITELAGGNFVPRAVTGASFTLVNGDGPPGKDRGAVGADKLALLACMEAWPEEQRRVRWFPPEPKDGETWAQAAGRRNREMVEARPERAYCVHTNLEASKGSSMTAGLLTSAGIPYWYIRVSPAGAVVSVEERTP